MKYKDWMTEPDIRHLTLKVLAEFFQDQFGEDPIGVGDWLIRNGTDVELFVGLVDELSKEEFRTPQEPESANNG